MPITQAQVDVLNQTFAQGEIYTGVTKPMASLTPITFVAGVPGAGTSVGLTSGPAAFKYVPEYDTVNVEQTLGPVAPRIKKETVTLDFTMAEDAVARLKLALPNSTLVTTTGTSPAPNTDVLYVGGKILGSVQQCVCLVSEIGQFTYMSMTIKLYEWVAIYNAICTSGLDQTFKLSESRMVKVTLTGYPDITRDPGDQYYQYGFMSAPA